MEDAESKVFTPLVMQTGLLCLGAHATLFVLFAYVLPKGPWTQLPSVTAHQAICLPLMIYVSYQGFRAWFWEGADLADGGTEARIFGVSPRGSDLGHVVFGMLLLWDIPVGLLTPGLRDALMAVHHLGMLFVSGIVVGAFSGGTPIGSYYAPFFFGVIELSTVFLCIVDLFHPKNKGWFEFLQNAPGAFGGALRSLNELCRSLFAVVYLALRTLYFPYVMFTTCLYDFWHAGNLPDEERHGATSLALVGVCLLAFLFTILQIYWGTLVGKQVAKALGLLPANNNSLLPGNKTDKTQD